MQLKNNSHFHLTYCTNIHPGESWDEVFYQLKSHLPELKKRIAPDQPFGIGLRLSAKAAVQLLGSDNLQSFKKWLNKENMYVFTMNGFPYGSFHGQHVKDRVYAPDWRKEERVEYTMNLIRILAELLPEGMDGGISTSPLSYKPWLNGISFREQVFRMGSEKLSQVAWQMATIYEEQGKELHLDIEPEPDCLLENTEETIDFFTNWLFPVGGEFLVGEYGLTHSKSEEILRNHIRVCYDTCHFAVEYENPQKALKQFREAGLSIGKVQISSALKVKFGDSAADRKTVASRIEPFAESTYLHQVIERRPDGSLHRFRDLPAALSNIENKKTREWRIHYHVPIFVDTFDSLSSTQDDIIQSLQLFMESGDCKHFEIETYTWDVLPEELKTDQSESIEREFKWVLNVIEEESVKGLNVLRN